MNSVLEKKYVELKNAQDYECWYLVKQPTAFDCLCYLVSFLEKYKRRAVQNISLQDYIGKEIEQLKGIKPSVEISNNYRALRVAAFFGLIMMTSSKYEEARITDTFIEITSRCSGEYEKTELYTDIIQRQIEKMFISSQIDEENERVRKDYRLYPVMLLYKVLLELGRSNMGYRISMPEYRYLVATTKTFDGFLETLLLIKLMREDISSVSAFEEFRGKFDNRLIQALKQLDTLTIDKDGILLKEDKIDEVAYKIYLFERNPEIFTTDNYLGFLCSTKSLFQLDAVVEAIKEEKFVSAPEAQLESERLKTGNNVLLYGVPGSGKSWTIEHEYVKPTSKVERLVFHPDYTYSDFVGQILPCVDDGGQVSYKFTPGPFTNILRDAYLHPQDEYILVIEEINRGNAPAIFGEIFQLLDRKVDDESSSNSYPVGTSEYGITNANIAQIVYGDPTHKVRIPSNLSVIGTMNTSDQNVFTLDTAFQRRWQMRLIENNFENVDPSFANMPILDTTVTWQKFCTEINKIIIGNGARTTSSEDKRLGAYFIHKRDLTFDSNMGDLKDGTYDALRKKESAQTITEEEKAQLATIRSAMMQNRRFPEKVIKYLWDDAFKFNQEVVFDKSRYQSLEDIIRAFLYSSGADRMNIFSESVRGAFFNTEA